jgi:hypothetical protein
VKISGTGLTGATSVFFDPAAATSFSADSDNQITAISPAGTGTVDVTGTTPSGTTGISAADRYTYTKPSPSAGP